MLCGSEQAENPENIREKMALLLSKITRPRKMWLHADFGARICRRSPDDFGKGEQTRSIANKKKLKTTGLCEFCTLFLNLAAHKPTFLCCKMKKKFQNGDSREDFRCLGAGKK